LGIAEHYEVINKELITVDNCVLKNFLDQIINGLENIYDELDSRFVVEKERFKLEMMNYRGFNEVGSSKEKFVSFVCRTFKLTLELYKLIRTHKLLYLAEMLEKTITFMYNEYVISKDYIAEFYYNLGCIELSLSNSRKATERLKVTFELIHSADYHKHLSYDKRVLDLIADNISWKSCFELVYEDVKQVLLEIGHEHECRDKLKACLEKVYQIAEVLECDAKDLLP